MNKVLDMMEWELKQAFIASGYENSLTRVVLSSRPDLCGYQCNGTMATAKVYRKKPINIADQVVEHLVSGGPHPVFSEAEAVMSGSINLRLPEAFLAEYTGFMAQSDKLGLEAPEEPETIIVDRGGANVAKPPHVDHLWAAIIGESIRRIGCFLGYYMIGDVHLGGWGLQMGLVIKELKDRRSELVCFDESFRGPLPQEASLTINELEEMYPATNVKSKADEVFREGAHQATLKLQRGYAPYRAIWRHIIAVSVADLKKNYINPNVEFDLWKGESDAEPYIGDMIQALMDKGLARKGQGILVVDVIQDTDTKEIPPCLVRKSDRASLYATSDLATVMEREQDFRPDRYIRVMGEHRGIHFEQVFRVAKRAGTVKEDTPMVFLGFSTMNEKDGKPFKIREGGVIRLGRLTEGINRAVYQKIMENRTISEDEARGTAAMVGLAALKCGDLSNQVAKDYAFDIERFTSFEGNTGLYIPYTTVRIKSIIVKYRENEGQVSQDVAEEKIFVRAGSPEKVLMLILVRYSEVLENSSAETAPHRICQYICELTSVFSNFCHDTKVLAEEDEARGESHIGLISLTRRVLEACIELSEIEAPGRM